MRPSYLRAAVRVVTVAVLALGLGAACGDDGTGQPDNLFLSVTSDVPTAGGSIDTLRVLLVSGDTRFPDNPANPDVNLLLGGLDPTVAPVLLSLKHNQATFGAGPVTVQVTGRIGGVAVASFEGAVDLAAKTIVDVHLRALPAGCDADGDGFLDCAIAGCCAGGASAFADCAPEAAEANPWQTEPECEPCEDTLDQDCDGTDVACVDADNDTIADCFEVACGAGDPTVGPGLAEVCDGADNDCDGNTDEGITATLFGATVGVGDACGVGACAGGVAECDGPSGLRCTTASQQLGSDTCGDQVDNDCDGETDEGCAGGTDLDGDGVTVEAGDCNDEDAGIYPGRAKEPCCDPAAQGDAAATAACDLDCSMTVTTCSPGDGDLDGFTIAQGDCDDTNPMVYPGAPERCGDGIDQDCLLGDLLCDGLTDGDNDGWPATSDCQDGDALAFPGADERCNGQDDDCDGVIDNGNPQAAAVCGSDTGACEVGHEVCVAGGILDCVGDMEATDERCDGVDNDCDGDTDEGFTYEMLALGASCDGVGACGPGTVACNVAGDNATCSTNADGAASQATDEVCDAVDNDCDGQLNEALTDVTDSTCLQVGVCATGRDFIVASCNPDDTGTWSCDYSAVPDYQAGSETACDTLDNDCDGGTDDEFGVLAGCDGDDEDVCDNGVVACDLGDADPVSTFCDESEAQNQIELCDGADNDCDGATDEDFKPGADNTVTYDGGPFAADAGGALGAACGTGACAAGMVICDAADPSRLTCSTLDQVAVVDDCDNIDDDCNGVTDDAYVDGTVVFSGGPNGADAGTVKGGACGTGACAGGTVVCETLTSLTCSTLDQIGDDVCDGDDNNCNGVADENFRAGGVVTYDGGPFAGDADKVLDAACGTGACATGTVVCDGTAALTCSTLGAAGDEDCDGVDDDCDGATDDETDIAAGDDVALAAAGCPTAGVCANTVTAACTDGAYVCSQTGASPPAGYAATEEGTDVTLCDDLDNDCDGSTDEAIAVDNSASNAGVAAAGCKVAGVCATSGSTGATCNVGAASGFTCSYTDTHYAAVETACDFRDNDCDGAVDSALGVPLGIAAGDDGALQAAGCQTVGVCAGVTTATCAASTEGVAAWTCDYPIGYDPNEGDVAEECNGLDDDCDDATDEGFPNQDDDAFADCVDDDIDGDMVDDNINGNGVGASCVGGATTACDDNCPFIDNPGQEDLDSDGIGDVCDPDVDGDTIPESGHPGTCTSGATTTCNDNCPIVANADQGDVDGDMLGDVCDPDADDDTILDDGDADGVRGGTPCTAGNRVGCDDNCPLISNGDQLDADSDGIGDACDDVACDDPEPFEVCGDCLDNTCSGGSDGAGCVYRRHVGVITETSGVAAGHVVSLTFDHQAMVTAGRSTAGGADVRLYYREPATGAYTELNRILDPDSAWNSRTTRVWFVAQAALAGAFSLDDDYRLYTGVSTGSPAANPAVVFPFFDAFDRGNSATVGNGWVETEAPTTSITITNSNLDFTTTADETFRPVVDVAFPAITSGRWEWRVGMDWTETAMTDPYLGVMMQLGDAATMVTPDPAFPFDYPNVGVGPSLFWGRPFAVGNDEHVLATEVGGFVGLTVQGTFQGPRTLRVAVDMDAGVYDLDFDQAGGPLEDEPFSTPQGSLDTIRLMTDELVESDFSARRFTHVWIRPLVASGLEPVAFLGLKEPMACALSDDALVARYYLDDRVDDPLGADAIVLKDAAAAPLPLKRNVANGQPVFFDTGGNVGLLWPAANDDGIANADYAQGALQTKVYNRINGSMVATIEVVVEIADVGGTDSVVVMLEQTNGSQGFGLLAKADGTLEARFAYGLAGTFDLDWRAAGRMVLHLVLDSTIAGPQAPRMKLYRDGVEVPRVAGNTIGPNLNNTVAMGQGDIAVGNAVGGDTSALQVVYYTAFYDAALTPAQVAANAAVLSADDDRRSAP